LGKPRWRRFSEIIADEVTFLSRGKGAGRGDVGENDIPY
jgi:hypothetical protein